MSYIHNGIEIVAKHFPGNSEYLVVSFMFGGRTEFAEKEFFLQGIQNKINIDLIGISTKVGKWYISKEMEDVIIKIKEITNKKIICVGVSMGGFASLKYGKALGAFSVLAFSPQWSINPIDLLDNPNKGERERFSQNFSSEMAEMSIKASDIGERTCIVYDPNDKFDKYHVEKILENSDTIDTVKSFYSGHHVVESLSGSINMKNILDCMNNYTFEKCNNVISNIRRKHPENIKRRINHCLSRFPRESISCLSSKKIDKVQYKEKIFSDFHFLGRVLYFGSLIDQNLSRDLIDSILRNRFYIKINWSNINNDFFLLNSSGKILTYCPDKEKFFCEENFLYPKNNPVIFSPNIVGLKLYFNMFGEKIFLYNKKENIVTNNCNSDLFPIKISPSFCPEKIKYNTFNVRTEHGYVSCDPNSGSISLKSNNDDLWENFVIIRNIFSI